MSKTINLDNPELQRQYGFASAALCTAVHEVGKFFEMLGIEHPPKSAFGSVTISDQGADSVRPEK